MITNVMLCINMYNPIQQMKLVIWRAFRKLLNGDETDNSKKFNKKNKKESDRDEEIDTVKDEKLKKVIQIKKDNQEDSIDEASVSEHQLHTDGDGTEKLLTQAESPAKTTDLAKQNVSVVENAVDCFKRQEAVQKTLDLLQQNPSFKVADPTTDNEEVCKADPQDGGEVPIREGRGRSVRKSIRFKWVPPKDSSGTDEDRPLPRKQNGPTWRPAVPPPTRRRYLNMVT
ncbi:hypothetical protein ACHWQZ_G017666 [Mnemiopsis leidyi]